MLALHSEPPEPNKALWDTLDVGYFMRHDAGDIAWHTRQLSAPHAQGRRTRSNHRAGPARPSAKACRCWSTRPTSPTCLRASAATSTRRRLQHPGRQDPHHPQRLCAGHLPGRDRHAARALPRADLAWSRPSSPIRWSTPARCPRPAAAGCRAASRASPFTPRVDLPRRKSPALAAEHQRQRPHRPAVQRGARAGPPPHQPATGQDHHLGERVEDTFLIDGPELQQNRLRQPAQASDRSCAPVPCRPSRRRAGRTRGSGCACNPDPACAG
jgi:[protein-PII] uridylyltransferase